MKIVSALTVLALVGCAHLPADMPPALRAILAPEFFMPPRAEISNEEVDQILEAFLPHRNADEFVSKLELVAPDGVNLTLSPIGPHGYSSATLRKKAGHWVYEISMGPL